MIQNFRKEILYKLDNPNDLIAIFSTIEGLPVLESDPCYHVNLIFPMRIRWWLGINNVYYPAIWETKLSPDTVKSIIQCLEKAIINKDVTKLYMLYKYHNTTVYTLISLNELDLIRDRDEYEFLRELARLIAYYSILALYAIRDHAFTNDFKALAVRMRMDVKDLVKKYPKFTS